jgi:spore germination protein YaaH
MLCRFPWRKLILGVFCLAATGCEPHRSWLRPQDDEAYQIRSSDKKAMESDASKMLSVDSDEKKSEPFFKNNRRSGAWSSEAREIERDLGVN